MTLAVIVSGCVPFIIASTVADTSDKCDQLRDEINKKRGENLAMHNDLI
eukprot:SAG31_NODE_23092_length_511_cov_1.497573_2_plen_48_part_01